MHWTCLADEPRTEFLKHALRREQNAQQAVRVLWIVGRMSFILMQRNRVGNFLRFRIDLHRNADSAQHGKQFAIERGDRFWSKGERAIITVGHSQLKPVIEEIELDFKRAVLIRNR